jgi:hypothetical protein
VLLSTAAEGEFSRGVPEASAATAAAAFVVSASSAAAAAALPPPFPPSPPPPPLPLLALPGPLPVTDPFPTFTEAEASSPPPPPLPRPRPPPPAHPLTTSPLEQKELRRRARLMAAQSETNPTRTPGGDSGAPTSASGASTADDSSTLLTHTTMTFRITVESCLLDLWFRV